MQQYEKIFLKDFLRVATSRTSMVKMIFAENLKIHIKTHELNQVKLANTAEISQSAISAWLKGKKPTKIVGFCFSWGVGMR